MKAVTNQKYLIVHMDDIGLGYAANTAAIELFQKGIVSSASVMVPCPWTFDFINWHRQNSKYDVGIHLTHTCEWDAYKWRPLAGKDQAPELYNPDGFMWKGVDKEINKVSPGQVKLEMRLQIEQAMNWGLKPSHIDTHMFAVAGVLENFKAYLDLAREYGIQAFIPQWLLWDDERRSLADNYGFPVVNNVSGIRGKGNDYASYRESLYGTLESVKPGLNELIIHPVTDTPEIRAIIPSWEQRNMEYRLFMDEETDKVIKDLGINVVNWADVKNIFKG